LTLPKLELPLTAAGWLQTEAALDDAVVWACAAERELNYCHLKSIPLRRREFRDLLRRRARLSFRSSIISGSWDFPKFNRKHPDALCSKALSQLGDWGDKVKCARAHLFSHQAAWPQRDFWAADRILEEACRKRIGKWLCKQIHESQPMQLLVKSVESLRSWCLLITEAIVIARQCPRRVALRDLSRKPLYTSAILQLVDPLFTGSLKCRKPEELQLLRKWLREVRKVSVKVLPEPRPMLPTDVLVRLVDSLWQTMYQIGGTGIPPRQTVLTMTDALQALDQVIGWCERQSDLSVVKGPSSALGQPVPAAGEKGRQATETKAVGAQGEPQRESPPPLTPDERAVLDLIRGLPDGEGITGKKIIAALRGRVDQSTLTSRIIPRLKRWWDVDNRRGVGYFVRRP
jgi:hypothetical protein